MADGLNEHRAIRIAEIMNDFATLQRQIADLMSGPLHDSPGRSAGTVLLRQCAADARAILAAQFATGICQTPAGGDGSGNEQEKAQLQRVLLDASTRRLQAQKIYLRASAAHRWAHYRTAVLQGAKPNEGHTLALQVTDEHLRAEVALITDSAVYAQLRSADQQAECWIGEDPPLRFIMRWMSTLSAY